MKTASDFAVADPGRVFHLRKRLIVYHSKAMLDVSTLCWCGVGTGREKVAPCPLTVQSAVSDCSRVVSGSGMGKAPGWHDRHIL